MSVFYCWKSQYDVTAAVNNPGIMGFISPTPVLYKLSMFVRFSYLPSFLPSFFSTGKKKYKRKDKQTRKIWLLWKWFPQPSYMCAAFPSFLISIMCAQYKWQTDAMDKHSCLHCHIAIIHEHRNTWLQTEKSLDLQPGASAQIAWGQIGSSGHFNESGFIFSYIRWHILVAFLFHAEK